MVWKNSNCEINSGNTLRPRYFRTCCWPRKSAHHWISKFFFNKLDGSIYSDEENADILESCSDHIDDGEILTQDNYHSPLLFSLKKHKRWLIPNYIKSKIDIFSNVEENFKITLAEHVNPGLGLDLFPKRALCVGYHDSEHSTSVYAHPGSCITDLRKRESQVDAIRSKSRKRIYHNLHKRALQRKGTKTKGSNITDLIQKNLKTSNNKKSSPAEDGGLPEIHYEVITPAGFTSSSANCTMRSRFGKKSFNKQKGERSKGKGMGYIKRDIQDQLKMDGYARMPSKLRRRIDSVKTDIIFQKRRQKKKQKTEGKEELKKSLDVFIVDKKQKTFRRSRRRKKKLKEHDTEDDGFVIVHKDNRKSVIPILPVNPASSALTKKYGKGHLIFEKAQNAVPAKDLAIVDTSNDQRLQDPCDESFTLFEDLLKRYNNNVCTVQILMEQISPRHLVKICGSKVDVGLVHPYTFVLELDENWSLACRMSPGLSLWPDPKGQTLVTIRVYLQSACKALSVIRANTALSVKLQEKTRNIYTLKELLHLTDIIRQEVSSVQEIIPRFNPKPEKTRNEVYEHLFSKSIQLTTAREIRMEHQLAKNPLPSYARLDFLDLLEVELCVVEECSVCYESWDGSRWSWLSHNMTLLPCRHSFCHSCWQTYLCYSITEGKTTFFCMEYGCETELDTPTVASLVPGPLLSRLQHNCDDMSEFHGWHLCPNIGCKYLIKFNEQQNKRDATISDRGVPVHCKCGEEWCLGCNKAPHWPALCHHSEVYHNMLIESDDDSGRPESKAKIHHRNTNRCPQCKLPVKMNGAVSCRCNDNASWRHLEASSALPSVSCHGTETEPIHPTTNSKLSQYKQCVRHRLAWKQLTSRAIARQSVHIVRSQRKQIRGPMIPSVMNQIIATEKFIRSMFQFVRDMHFLLENCCVLISNVNKSRQLEDFTGCCAQVDFLNTRIENTLTSTEGQKDKMLTRLKSLSHLAWAYIDRLVKIVPYLQSSAEENGHQQELVN